MKFSGNLIGCGQRVASFDCFVACSSGEEVHCDSLRSKIEEMGGQSLFKHLFLGLVGCRPKRFMEDVEVIKEPSHSGRELCRLLASLASLIVCCFGFVQRGLDFLFVGDGQFADTLSSSKSVASQQQNAHTLRSFSTLASFALSSLFSVKVRSRVSASSSDPSFTMSMGSSQGCSPSARGRAGRASGRLGIVTLAF